jgi:hypothetical protein
MKKVLLVAALAIACLCLSVAPALAANPETLRPPEGAATVWDGWWFEYLGDDAGTWWMCNDPTWQGGQPPWPDYKAVSLGQPIIHFGMWIGVGYGYMKNIPDTVLMTVDVWGPYDPDVPPDPAAPNDPDMLFQQFSAEEVKQFWTGPYEWDDFWSRFYYGCWILEGDLWTPEPFNPRIGAGVYGNNIMLPLGPFTEPGRYHVEHTWWTARPMTEKIYQGEPARPIHSAAGGQSGTFPFDMYVVETGAE